MKETLEWWRIAGVIDDYTINPKGSFTARLDPRGDKGMTFTLGDYGYTVEFVKDV